LIGRTKSIRRGLIAVVLLFVLAFIIDSTQEPNATIKTVKGNIPVPDYQGTYSWSSPFKSLSADYPIPPEMLKDKTATVVAPSSLLLIKFDYKPIKGSLYANLWIGEKAVKQEITDGNKIKVPVEKGIYIYDIWAKWKEGSRSYVFAVEVK